MTSPNPKSARTVAAIVLNRFDPKYDNAREILNEMLRQTAERQRATDLVYGSTRNRWAIDIVIVKLADCPIDRIQSTVLNIIRIGAYELIYCPQAPEYSIVNEAVEYAKTVAGEKRAGFVNAVLRQIERHIKNRQSPLSEAPVEKTLPQTTTTGCEFDTDILRSPEDSPADYFSRAFSLPKWLIDDWLGQFDTERLRQVCLASNRRPSIYIRPNALKITLQQLAEKLRQADIDLEIVTESSMIKIKSPQAVTELPGFAEGLFSVQDITAAESVKLLQPQPGWTILDLCAAPGTKTTQLAEVTGDKAKIIATDIDSERLKKVKENVSRLGLNSVSVVEYENLQEALSERGLFDCILLDVPCSNSGVLAKRAEVRHRISKETIQTLTITQTELLESAKPLIKPKGKICYSTCSIQKCENSELVADFLKKNPELKLESENLVLPSAEGFDRDGGYAAILTKR